MIYLNKKSIRLEILDKRGKLGKEDHKTNSDKIIQKIYDSPFYKNASTIMTFISFGDEVDTHEFIKTSIKNGKKIVVPITVPEKKELKLSQVKDFSELEIGHYNILTPKEEFLRFVDPKDVDLIIVPGVAFDREGYRIGYGGGYYDRFLSSKVKENVPKISIAFSLQIIDKVPREHFDIPVDYIYTEKEIINCK